MGFAAEIKEFLSSAKETWKLSSDTDYKTALQKQAEEATAKSKEEREDPDEAEGKKLKNALLRAKIASENSASASAASGRSAIDAANAPIPIAAAPPVIGTDSNATPDPAPPKPAIGTGYARGGLVKKYAVGGMADDDDDDDDVPAPQQAVPTAASAPAGIGAPAGAAVGVAAGAAPGAPGAPAVGPAVGGGAGYDISARRRAPTPLPDTGVTAGLKYLAETSGIGQGAIQPALRQQALQRYARGAGGAPAVDMAQVFKKVDPDNKMPESVRNLNAINGVYNFYQSAGDPVKAKSAAAQMLQYYRTASSQYAALAKAAAGDGNMDAATKMFTKSYANIPDGQDAKLWVNKDGNIGYTIKNQDGTETHKGIMSPQQFGSQLMKVSPADFDQHLITAAGERYRDAQDQPIVKPGKGSTGQKSSTDTDISKVSDQSKLQDEISSHVDDFVTKAKKAEGGDKKDFTDNEVSSMKNAMFHIRRNNDVTNDEALRAAQTYVTAPEPKTDKDPVPFKVTKDKESGTATIKYANGREIEMPMNDYLPLAAMRGKALAEQEAAKSKADEDSKKETYGDMLGRAGKAAVGTAKEVGQTLADDPSVRAVGDAAKRVTENVKGASVPGDLPGIPELARRAGRALSNPDDDKDRRVDAPL